MLLEHWSIVIVCIATFKLLWALNCNDQSICIIKPEAKSFTEQIIEAAKYYSNTSFTLLLYAGDYTTTRSRINFINFTNVTIKNHPDNVTPVNIMCPEFTITTHNGIGFESSSDITISGLNFMKCGPITSGLYFRYTRNINIINSSFHHNSNNGIQIQFGAYGNNIIIKDCNFFYNVGLQPDSISDLITDGTFTRGAGLGLVFEYESNITVTIDGCNFTSNIAYKNPDYNSSAETRPYGSIPLGNGGGIYLSLYRVKNSSTSVSNCNFYNNTAIHQGGAIVMIPLNSTDNILNISKCTFVGNKVLGYFLRSLTDAITESSYSIIQNFVDRINFIFSSENFNFNSLSNVTFSRLSSSGGFGGAIAVSLFGSVERNALFVSSSHFTENVAFSAGAIGFAVRDLLANVEYGIDSNQAFIHKYVHFIMFINMLFFVASYLKIHV